MATNFQWQSGQGLPSIEPHTERKLEVIERYLDVYFDTYARNPRMDELRISIVDGFCGGGAYQRGGELIHGSPMVLLRAVRAAQARLNIGRQKSIEIKAQFYFSDLSRHHVEVLRETILASEFRDELNRSIHLQTGKFEELLPDIIKRIRASQRKGRSIFVLDQWGYSDVPMPAIRRIFKNLGRAEVILTFSIDALLNYLREDGAGSDRLQQFGVDRGFIADWHSEWKKDENLGRATAQRLLMSRLHDKSGALFFTPFMLFSSTDNRWMMLAHLSQHQAARDKMLSVHWGVQNRFKHIGKGSLFELGFDHRLHEDRDSLFSFSAEDRSTLHTELETELPSLVDEMMPDNSLPVEALLHGIGNRTAAENRDILEVLGRLSQEKILHVARANGSMKRPQTKVSTSDILIKPSQRTFIFR